MAKEKDTKKKEVTKLTAKEVSAILTGLVSKTKSGSEEVLGVELEEGNDEIRTLHSIFFNPTKNAIEKITALKLEIAKQEEAAEKEAKSKD